MKRRLIFSFIAYISLQTGFIPVQAMSRSLPPDEQVVVKKALGMLLLAGALERDQYAELYYLIDRGCVKPVNKVVSCARALVVACTKAWEASQLLAGSRNPSKEVLDSIRIVLSEYDLIKRIPENIEEFKGLLLGAMVRCSVRSHDTWRDLLKNSFFRVQRVYESIDRLGREGFLDLQESTDQQLYALAERPSSFTEYVLSGVGQGIYEHCVAYLHGDGSSRKALAEQLVKELSDFLVHEGIRFPLDCTGLRGFVSRPKGMIPHLVIPEKVAKKEGGKEAVKKKKRKTVELPVGTTSFPFSLELSDLPF
jgi:hypothetical protein